MMKQIMAGVLILFSSTVYSEADVTLHVDKDWGLQLGDQIHIQATLAAPSAEVDRSSLPDIHERYGNWLFLQDLQLQGNQIELTWQLVNVADKSQTIFTPKIDVRLKDDSWLSIPSHPLMISPALATAQDAVINITAKPAHPPIWLPVQRLQERLQIMAMLTFLAGGILLIWHFGWRPGQRRPFAQALHDLRKMQWRQHEPEQSIRILHKAFNRTAGTVIVPHHLELLFEKAPWLLSLRDDISRFYQQSAHYFFSRDKTDRPDEKTIKKLARACRDKEKMA